MQMEIMPSDPRSFNVRRVNGCCTSTWHWNPLRQPV